MNNKYWEEEIETMPREQLRELQLQRLKKTVSIAANSPYYLSSTYKCNFLGADNKQ